MSVYVLLSPIGGAGQQFFDNNGNVLSGGKLYTYAAGTTTPLATYTTSAGTTANANPIVLGSDGRVSGGVWLTYDSQYKFVLKTSADVTLWTQDNISGIASTGLQISETVTTLAALPNIADGTRVLVKNQGFYRYDSSSVVTADGYLVVTPSGGTGRWILEVDGDVQRQYVSVKTFGATGDGTTDDTVAINACLAASQYVFFPPGTYRVTSPLVCQGATYQYIKGAGQNTTIQTKAGFTGYGVFQNWVGAVAPPTTGASPSYLYISDLNVTNDLTLTNTAFFYFLHLWEGSYIKNIYTSNVGTMANVCRIDTNSDTNGTGGRLNIENWVTYDTGGAVTGSYTGSMFDLHNSGGFFFKKANFSVAPTAGNVMRVSSTADGITHLEDLHFENTPGGGNASLHVVGSAHIVIDSCDFEVGTVATGNKYAIVLDYTGITESTANYCIQNCTTFGASVGGGYFTAVVRYINNAGSATNYTGTDITGITWFSKVEQSFNPLGTVTRLGAHQFSGTVGITGDATLSAKLSLTAQSRFAATLSANQTGIADNAVTVVAFNTESVDTQGEFDTALYRFTAEDSGCYMLSASVYVTTAIAGAGIIELLVYNAGSLLTRLVESYGRNGLIAGSAMLFLSAGDVIDIRLACTSIGNTTTVATTSSGSFFKMARIA